jgi:[acyl-carrier-protein] S-malonyltransferase
MGKAWFGASPEARGVFERADRALGSRLGAPLSEICFAGPAERLNRTDVSQPAIYVTSVACWRGLLAQRGLGENDLWGGAVLAGAAGLSLGEYTALHLAGAISFEDGLELVTLRGRSMQDAAEAAPGGMVALIGADEAQAMAVCDAALSGGAGSEVLVAANFNAPGQVVLSGSKGACERAAAEAQKRGLKAAPLAVAGAFHSPLMQPAATRLAGALAGTTIREPRCPVLSNVTGFPHGAASGLIMGLATAGGSVTAGADAIRQRLVDQLTMPVRWEACCRWLGEHVVGRVGGEMHEVAPGKTLAGLMRRIDKALKVSTHEEPGGGAQEGK